MFEAIERIEQHKQGIVFELLKAVHACIACEKQSSSCLYGKYWSNYVRGVQCFLKLG